MTIWFVVQPSRQVRLPRAGAIIRAQIGCQKRKFRGGYRALSPRSEVGCAELLDDLDDPFGRVVDVFLGGVAADCDT